MSPKPNVPVYNYAKLPSIGLLIRPLPYPPTTNPDSDDARNPNAPSSNTDTQIIPANQAYMDHHPDDNPDQEERHIPANQSDMDDPNNDHDQEEEEHHPVVNNNNNVPPETPSKFAAIALEQMMLASPAPRYQPVRPRARTMGADHGESFLQQHVMRGPPDPESFMQQRAMSRQQEQFDGFPRLDRNESERRHPPPRTNTINAVNNNRFAGNETNEGERTNRPPPRHNRIAEGDIGLLTPTRNPGAVVAPLAVQTPQSRMPPPLQTPASRMLPPPQTPASRIKVPQSPASRLLKRTASPAYVVRSTGTHDGVHATPGVVRVLFPSPSPKRNVSEYQPVRPRIDFDPLPQSRRSRRISVSFASAMINEDTEMDSPSVAATAERPATAEKHVMTTTPQSRTGETKKVITPDSQTGGSPPVPQTPRTPRTWISLSQITPAIEARMRMRAKPLYEYRNPEEQPMEMTPSPPTSEPACSPDDRKMEDALWTPSKQGASSNSAGFREKLAAAEKLPQWNTRVLSRI